MNSIEMRLQDQPFDLISEGSKTIEVRLYDEKRQKIKVGDKIKFSRMNNAEDTLEVSVLALLIYRNFQELFKDFPAENFGGEGMNIDELVANMQKYYSREEQDQYGVLGIKFNLLES